MQTLRTPGTILRQLLLLLLVGYGLTPALSSAGNIPEYKLKAAYLYNFASFTSWPEYGETFHLCIFGENPFRKNLDRIRSKRIVGRPIKIHLINTIESLDPCQLVFISAEAKNRMNQVLEHVANQPILTIADTPKALNSGIVINMSSGGKRVSFEVNLTAAKRQGLKISSKLLRLAKRVVK